MSLLTENIVPGKHGKIFTTDAKDQKDLERIKSRISSLNGIEDVIINSNILPVEIIIHTSILVKVAEIEKKVQAIGFHLVPKNLFE